MSARMDAIRAAAQRTRANPANGANPSAPISKLAGLAGLAGVADLERAEQTLKEFADRHGMPWPAIRPHLTDDDLIGGLEALEHFGGPVDNKNFELVRWWLERVLERARSGGAGA